MSHLHSINHPDFLCPVENGYDEDSDDGGVRRGKRYHPPREIDGGSMAKVASNATLVHYDLNPRNIAVVRRGKPKLNDFNVAEFMTWDAKNNRMCSFPWRFREPWWRLSKEMHFHTPINNRTPVPLMEKVDIHLLGNVLMEILTTHSPWGTMQKGETEEEKRPKVARGELPEFPANFNATGLASNPVLAAIYGAMRKCLRFQPEDRPTAGEIAAKLFDTINNLLEGFGNKEK